MIHLLTPIYEDLGFDNKETDSLLDQRLRQDVIKAMSKLEHKVLIISSSSQLGSSGEGCMYPI
jgi:hypothetical protein